MSNVNKGFQLFDTGGEPLEGRDIILKDVDGLLTDVVATEAKNGIYFAEVPLGSMWNVWDNTTPPGSDTGFILDAGSSRTREPAIPPGAVSTDVWTAVKAFNPITMAMVYGLPAALAAETAARVLGDASEAQARENAAQYLLTQIEALSSGVGSSTVVLGSMTCSRRHRSIRKVDLVPYVPTEFDAAITVPSSGAWTDIGTISGGGAGDENLFDELGNPWSPANVLIPGAMLDFGVQLAHSYMPATAGAPNTTLCDFRFAFARIGVDGVISSYSDWITPSSQASQRISTESLAGGVYQAWCMPATPIECVHPGGNFAVKVQAKVKTAGTAINIGKWHHAVVDIILFPKAG